MGSDRTGIVRNNPNPSFDTTFRFNVTSRDELRDASLEFTVMDRDRGFWRGRQTDDLIGSIELSVLNSLSEVPTTYDLSSRGGQIVLGIAVEGGTDSAPAEREAAAKAEADRRTAEARQRAEEAERARQTAEEEAKRAAAAARAEAEAAAQAEKKRQEEEAAQRFFEAQQEAERQRVAAEAAARQQAAEEAARARREAEAAARAAAEAAAADKGLPVVVRKEIREMT